MRRYWLFSQFGTQLTKGHKWDVLSQLWGAGWNCVPIDFGNAFLRPTIRLALSGIVEQSRRPAATSAVLGRMNSKLKCSGQTLPPSLYIILNVAWPTEGS
jgi:hypothetical protein